HSFFYTDTATTEIYTLSLHDALPISASFPDDGECGGVAARSRFPMGKVDGLPTPRATAMGGARLFRSRPRFRFGGHGQDHRRIRSEEHTSELQSLAYLVCRLLLEKKK